MQHRMQKFVDKLRTRLYTLHEIKKSKCEWKKLETVYYTERKNTHQWFYVSRKKSLSLTVEK